MGDLETLVERVGELQLGSIFFINFNVVKDTIQKFQTVPVYKYIA